MNQFEPDKDLLRGLARQDRDIIEKIYRLNYPMVQHMVLNNNGSIDDAADIFQETMIVLFEKANDVHFELNCLLKTFIYSVARRMWLKKLQKQQKYSLVDDNFEPFISVEDDVEEHQKKQTQFNTMEIALNKIGEPCKSLLEAFYFSKKNMQDIAQDFQYTNADNAKTQKYKCLMRLKKLFFSEYNRKSD